MHEWIVAREGWFLPGADQNGRGIHWTETAATQHQFNGMKPARGDVLSCVKFKDVEHDRHCKMCTNEPIEMNCCKCKLHFQFYD